MNLLRPIAWMVLLVLGRTANANMASPWHEGAKGAFPLVSRQLDVVGETLHIRVFGACDSAQVSATYRIAVPAGVRGALPLLFVALDRYGMARLRVVHNGAAVRTGWTGELPGTELLSPSNEDDRIQVNWWGGRSSEVYQLHDLEAFTLDLEPGLHTVEVHYSTKGWQYLGSWVREHSIRYALSPAQHWKSFGPLDVIVETAPVNAGRLVQSLGAPNEGSIPGTARWHFTELPADLLTITHIPAVPLPARALMGLSPFGIALFVGLTLLLLHVRWMHRFRMRVHTGRSMPLVVGALLAPLLFLLAFALAYPLIDAALGDAASGRHGYEMLAVPFFYPIITPLYALGCWLLDRYWKRRMPQVQ